MNNYDYRLSVKNNSRNNFRTITNKTKKEENSFGNTLIKNYININNINISRNDNKFSKYNNYAYTTIFKNYKTRKLNINKRNIINPINQSSSFHSKNEHSNLSNFKDLFTRPSSYKSVFANKTPKSVLNLKDYMQNANKLMHNKPKKKAFNKLNILTLQNSLRHFATNKNLKIDNNNYQKIKCYQQKFLNENILFNNKSQAKNNYNCM